jgi:hypothetical protein
VAVALRRLDHKLYYFWSYGEDEVGRQRWIHEANYSPFDFELGFQKGYTGTLVCNPVVYMLVILVLRTRSFFEYNERDHWRDHHQCNAMKARVMPAAKVNLLLPGFHCETSGQDTRWGAGGQCA